MEIIDNKALLVRTDDPTRITQAISKSRLIRYENDEAVVAVNWEYPETTQMAALGWTDIPSPILRDYNWPGPLRPFAHQRTTSSFLTAHKRAFCFNEQGSGKTLSVVWAADYLMKLGLVHRVLILCPLSIMKAAWQADLFKAAMHRSCGIAYGSAQVRRDVINSGAEFVIINFDGAKIVEQDIIAGGFDLVIVDECTSMKNVQTQRWKTVNRIVQATDPRLWMMTGTPAAQSPIDAYGLGKLVNPANCPANFGTFQDSVMFKVKRFVWAPKPQSKAIVHKLLQPAIRFEKKDCLDLPPVMHTERHAPLTPQQRAYYKQLKKELVFEADGETVSAVNAAVKLNKLLQISGGAVYTDEGEVIEFDISSRMSVVLEAIGEAGSKVLVFVPFTHTIELLKARLAREGISCGVLSGKVSANKRAETVQAFQTTDDPHVLLIQPQAAAHGLTLTAADTVIWYSPVPSVETYLQANARIDRPGQENHMTVVHVYGSDVESRLYRALSTNVGNHKQLVNLYRDILANADD